MRTFHQLIKNGSTTEKKITDETNLDALCPDAHAESVQPPLVTSTARSDTLIGHVTPTTPGDVAINLGDWVWTVGIAFAYLSRRIRLIDRECYRRAEISWPIFNATRALLGSDWRVEQFVGLTWKWRRTQKRLLKSEIIQQNIATKDISEQFEMPSNTNICSSSQIGQFDNSHQARLPGFAQISPRLETTKYGAVSTKGSTRQAKPMTANITWECFTTEKKWNNRNPHHYPNNI